MKVYLKRLRTGIEAIGDFDIDTKNLTVLKGSQISSNISTSPRFNGKKRIGKIREGLIKDGVLQENITFKSPSTAANFVTGTSCNGLITWKDKDGRKIKEILK